MLLLNGLCAFLALVLAGLSTIVAVPLMFLYGALHKLLLLPWTNHAWAIGRAWYHFMHIVCVRTLLQVKVEAHLYLRAPVCSDDSVIWVGNHPSMMAIPSLFSLFVRRIKQEVLAVSKIQNKRSATALAAWSVDGWIYIDRSDRQSALTSIREGIREVFNPRRALVIFPDGRRPTRKRIEDARQKLKPHIENLDDIPTETLPWKYGGIQSFFTAMQGQPYRLLRVTNGFSVRDEGRHDILKVIGSTFLMRIDEIDPPEALDDDSCRRWANQHYAITNTLLHNHRSKE